MLLSALDAPARGGPGWRGTAGRRRQEAQTDATEDASERRTGRAADLQRRAGHPGRAGRAADLHAAARLARPGAGAGHRSRATAVLTLGRRRPMPPRTHPNDEPDEPRIFTYEQVIPDAPDEPRTLPQPADPPGQQPGSVSTDPVAPAVVTPVKERG